MPEQDLVARARGGDRLAFEALVAGHAPYVYNLALRTLGDPHEAEDLAQEAFLRAWRGLPGFRADARFSTWLYRIVTNLCYNRLPGLRAALAALDVDAGQELPDEHQQVDRGLTSDELAVRIHAAIDALPDGYRLLITLRHLQEMSYTDIAAATGLPLGTVKTGLHRARRELRAALESGGSDGATPADAAGRVAQPVDASPSRNDPHPPRSAPDRACYDCTRLEVTHA